jgi:hypothetical protein
MRRKFINPQKAVVQQAIIDYRHATVRMFIEQLQPLSTFSEIATIIGKSHEFVRSRLVGLHRRENVLLVVSGRYQVPRQIAEQFIRSIYGL